MIFINDKEGTKRVTFAGSNKSWQLQKMDQNHENTIDEDNSAGEKVVNIKKHSVLKRKPSLSVPKEKKKRRTINVASRPDFCIHCKKEFTSEIIDHCKDCTSVPRIGKSDLYHCTMCDYHVYVRSAMNYHINRHLKRRLYKCDYCNYSCVLPFRLREHQRRHTGEMPFQCLLCDFKCSFGASLQRHMRLNKHNKEL